MERDGEGRPRCVHGWANKAGSQWKCRAAHMAANQKYAKTEKGRATERRRNATAHARSRKELYELTRIRTY